MREKIIPRISQKTFERGAIPSYYLESVSIKKGSYTFKISSGQNFF